jgi:hypothetical protein
MYSLEEKVDAGVALLDMEHPSWYRDVDPKTLNMQTVDACMLGQCFERYSDGKRELGITLGEPFGFSMGKVSDIPHERRKAWEKLRQLWIERIEARLLVEELEAAELSVA